MISLRNSLPSDDLFLLQLYATTRAAEMAMVDWSDEQKSAFLTMQFNAQRNSYRMQFPQATYQVITDGEVRMGRLITDRTQRRLLLMDIALLPEYRNRGIGTRLIRELQQEAESAKQKIGLHVEPYNPAFRLYQRLGFVPIAEAGFYIEMEWQQNEINSPREDDKEVERC